MRIISAYRIVSTSAVVVLGSVPPIDLLAKESQEAFLLRKEHNCVNNEQEIARVKEAIRNRLIPEIGTWLERKHGEVGFYLTQALSGHGCFNAYLKRFKRKDEETCLRISIGVGLGGHLVKRMMEGMQNDLKLGPAAREVQSRKVVP